MITVSEKFRKLAQDNGREVWCRITVGSEEFLDDRITDMTFDDVIHPDWFTVGTTCSNRLHFTARYSGELSSGAEVRAYISFDGEEWCPLGVFYISRRYVRGKYVSVTAYDKMYSLDVNYGWKGELPVTSDVLLRDICSSVGVECAEAGQPIKLEKLPENSTAQDLIGYIAGINRACAKIDRTGRLTLKYHSPIDFELQDKNCWEIQRNMGSSVVTCVKAHTGDEDFTAGGGADISTIEIYNPFMTQKLTEDMYVMYKPFSFYGAELHMQGMPFLESGDSLYFLDGSLLYRIVISEIEYSYDGGLSAVLYSKNKVYEEESSDLEKLLEELLHKKNAVYYKRENSGQINVKPLAQIIADFEFESEENMFAQLDVNFTVKNSTADQLIIGVNVNGKDIPRSIVQTLSRTDFELLHVYHLAEKLPAGKNRVYVTAQTKSGEAYIPAGDMLATLVGHGIYGNVGSSRDKITLYERLPHLSMVEPKLTLKNAAAHMDKEVT